MTWKHKRDRWGPLTRSLIRLVPFYFDITHRHTNSARDRVGIQSHKTVITICCLPWPVPSFLLQALIEGEMSNNSYIKHMLVCQHAAWGLHRVRVALMLLLTVVQSMTTLQASHWFYSWFCERRCNVRRRRLRLSSEHKYCNLLLDNLIAFYRMIKHAVFLFLYIA